MASGGSITWDLDVDGSKLTSGLSKASQEAKGASKTIGGTLSKAFKDAEKSSKIFTGVVVAGFAAIAAGGIKAVQASRIQQRAEAELIQLHKENTGATDEQVRSLFDLAAATQNLGVIGDESIIMGQSQLATFKLSTEAIKSLTPAMADMVAKQKGFNATGEDFVNIGNLIGKVMEGQVGALGRYGVSFSDAQEKILKTGDEVERAATLAEVLEQNYGGVNEALRNTPEGAMKAVTNTMGDMLEIVGAGIDNAILPITTAFNNWVTEMGGAEGVMNLLNEKMEELKGVLPVVAGIILGGMTPALYAAAAGAWALVAPLLPFLIIGGLVGLLVKLIIDRMGGFGAVMEKIEPILNNFKDIITKNILPMLQLFADNLGKLLGPTLHDIGNIVTKELIPALMKLWEQISPILIPVLKVLGVMLAGTLGIALAVVVAGIKLLVIAITGAIMILTEWIANIRAFVSRIIENFKWLYNVIVGNSIIPDLINGIISWFGRLPAAIVGLVTRLITSVVNLFQTLPQKAGEALSGLASAITAKFQEAFEGAKKIVGKMVDQLKRLSPLHKESPSLVDNIVKGVATIKKQYNSLGSLEIPSIQELSGSFAPIQHRVEVAGNREVSRSPVTFNVNIGTYAGTDMEFRELSRRIFDAYDDYRKGRGEGI